MPLSLKPTPTWQMSSTSPGWEQEAENGRRSGCSTCGTERWCYKVPEGGDDLAVVCLIVGETTHGNQQKSKVKVDLQAEKTHQWEHVELKLGLWSSEYPNSSLTNLRAAAKTSARANKGRTHIAYPSYPLCKLCYAMSCMCKCVEKQWDLSKFVDVLFVKLQFQDCSWDAQGECCRKYQDFVPNNIKQLSG